MIRGFISYCHADKRMCMELRKHLYFLEKAKIASFWVDERLTAGEPLAATIEERLHNTDVALLLVSVNFFWSDFIQDRELPLIQERAKANQLIYIPVILNFVTWEALNLHGIGAQLAVPLDGKPIQAFKPQGKGFVDAAQRIANRVTQLHAARAS